MPVMLYISTILRKKNKRALDISNTFNPPRLSAKTYS